MNLFKNLSIVFSLLLILSSCSSKKNKDDISQGLNSSFKIEKPNIIFYLADDQDVYDYGCYGNEK